MAILDVFKKREGKEDSSPKKSLKIKAPLREEDKKKEKKKTERKVSISKKNVLSSPYFTEKTDILNKEDKYTFKTMPNANKTELKKEIEEKYKVKVKNIKIINVKRKKKRLGRHEGWKKGYKKAIVRIKEGQKIETV